MLALPATVSVAVLPNAPHAREMATKAHGLGHEVLIHLPMAPLSKQLLEKDTLRPDMSSAEIERIIREAYGKVPYAVGLNNHMGSAMTSSLFGMQKVMQALERYNLYFLDSVTIGNSQAMRAAQGTGVKVIKRKVFLDDTQNEADIRVSVQPGDRPGRAVTVRRLLSATRTPPRCACCSRWSIACRRTLPSCARAACSTSRRWIPPRQIPRRRRRPCRQRSRVIRSAA
ncbi:Divergent polysaccharide deacetylase [Raoultella terrigena]|uniref:Divergent polysaccharide deacetylase n=1 Tax=Raoultella terrigena TaxID=577 RepID=A0A4U9D9H2_RAOTE|nr:Divergent polysaccharide deacetylase [Raoultella terrigena]